MQLWTELSYRLSIDASPARSLRGADLNNAIVVVVVVVTRSDQPKPPAVAIVRQNGMSSASCRASVAVTPVSRQIWWIQVVSGRPLARLHSCEGRSPSLALVQIRRIWFADLNNSIRLRNMELLIQVAANWFRRLLRHPARKRIESVLTPGNSHGDVGEKYSPIRLR